MQLQTILNRVERHKSFVYKHVRFDEHAADLTLQVEIEPRANGRPICSGCGELRPGYDRLPTRTFDFVPLWGIPVFFVYALRRVDCPNCGVKVERVPWAQGKSRVTTTYAWFLAGWAKRLSWKEVARVFQTSWDTVVRSVKMAVAWGLEHRNLAGIRAIGIDESAWGPGQQKYATLVYQIDAGAKRLLWIGRERTEKTLRRFFETAQTMPWFRNTVFLIGGTTSPS